MEGFFVLNSLLRHETRAVLYHHTVPKDPYMLAASFTAQYFVKNA